MMSANSSLNKKYRKVVCKQRTWVSAITWLTFLITNVVLPTLALASIRHDWMGGSRIRTLPEAMQNMTGRLMPKYEAVIWFFAAVLAILLAFQGFAWMDSKRQVDFYESQPVSRAKHFWSVVRSSFEIFIVSYLVTMAIAALVTLVMGAYSNDLLLEGVRVTVKVIVVFAGFYAISVLAMVLTGNIIVAGLAAGVFFFYEFMAKFMIEILKRNYYRTYMDQDLFDVKPWTSPAYWYLVGNGRGFLPGGIVLAIAVMAIAFAVYRIRKNEDAGEAVLHKPVRILAKIAVGFLAGLFAMAACIGSSLPLIPSLIFGACAAAVIGCIMEAIYNADVRQAFKGIGWTAVAAVLAAAVFCTIYFDLTGYDRWVPDKDKVKDAYITTTSYMGSYFDTDGSYIPDEGFPEKYMSLTDIDAVNALLKAGEDYLRNQNRDMLYNAGYEAETDSFLDEDSKYETGDRVLIIQIYYRMKNGKTCSRQIQIPRNTSSALLNPIFGSDEYKNGALQIYHDDFVMNNLKSLQLSAYSPDDVSDDVPADEYYEMIREAYLKDLEGLDWTYDLMHQVVAEIVIEGKTQQTGNFYGGYFPVYDGFENTLKAMKEAGISIKPAKAGEMPGIFGYE